MDAFRIAHLTDPHLPLGRERPGIRALLSKRLLGYLSWKRRRCRFHRPEVLAALVRDMADHAPDHICLTGDIANISLPDEFARGRDWLASVAQADRLSYVPGNHDALVPVPWAEGLGLWADWMAGDGADAAAAKGPADLFPFARVRGPVAIVGLNSGLPTPIGMATGSVGSVQREKAEAMLAEFGRRGLFRIVLLHHPLAEGAVKRRKALTDRGEVRAMLARAGAELVLHGHAHYAHFAALPGPGGAIPSLTAPSASALPDRHYDGARWSLISVQREGDRGWRAEVTVRALDGAGTGFVTAGRYTLLSGTPAPAP